jgi:hypothetical protein
LALFWLFSKKWNLALFSRIWPFFKGHLALCMRKSLPTLVISHSDFKIHWFLSCFLSFGFDFWVECTRFQPCRTYWLYSSVAGPLVEYKQEQVKGLTVWLFNKQLYTVGWVGKSSYISYTVLYKMIFWGGKNVLIFSYIILINYSTLSLKL